MDLVKTLLHFLTPGQRSCRSGGFPFSEPSRGESRTSHGGSLALRDDLK